MWCLLQSKICQDVEDEVDVVTGLEDENSVVEDVADEILGSVCGRKDYSRIFVIGPPDVFVDFVAGSFLLILREKVPRKILQETRISAGQGPGINCQARCPGSTSRLIDHTHRFNGNIHQSGEWSVQMGTTT